MESGNREQAHNPRWRIAEHELSTGLSGTPVRADQDAQARDVNSLNRRCIDHDVVIAERINCNLQRIANVCRRRDINSPGQSNIRWAHVPLRPGVWGASRGAREVGSRRWHVRVLAR